MDKDKITKFTESKINEYMSENINEQSLFKALKMYDSLTKEFNHLFELIEDWYALQNHKRYKEINDNFKFIKYIDETNVEELKKDIAFEVNLERDDLQHIKELARITKELYSERSKLEVFIKNNANSFYPNISNLVGPILTVRLINMTKSLKNFSELPSSTIQMIGAETALFRHLKYGKKSPKYGYLYEHPLMQSLSNHNKGKLARTIANKVSLAAKFDFLGKNVDNNLKKEIEEKAKELKGEEK